MIMKGQKISDRYQIVKSIGEGGMANVYLAYDTILDRDVAVKILRGDLANDEKFVRRFQREALSASSLNHQNIVEVYDVGEDNGDYYIVMEYIQGKHLKELIKKRGKLTTTEAIDIMLQITDGMSVAHDSYLIHRDIKPQNIMILENGLIKITDFGISLAMNSTQLTQTNSVMGSVHYLPPEQANGKGSTLQSDIYSIGIVMYELLTGKLPYKGDNAVEIALKHLKETLPSIKEELPNLPQSIVNIVTKATAKNPKNRYADAREMHEDLLTCMSDDRINEAPIKFKYPETNFDDTKVTKMLKKEKDNDKEDKDELIAKQMTKKDMKKQNKLLIILLAIFTGLVVVITSVVVLIPIITNQAEIYVPDVTGKTVSEAIQLLQDEGFTVSDNQQTTSSSEIAEGLIVKTNPAAGSKRTSGTEVILWVSTGEDKILIEDYTGSNYLEVKGKLETLGLQVLVEKKETDDTSAEENIIIGQSVEAGTKLSKDDIITLYIPLIQATYPDFTDGSYSLNDVITYLQDYNVTVKSTEVVNDDVEAGTITKQSIPAGYIITEGQTLTITIAKSSTTTTTTDDDNCEEEGLC